MFEFVVMLIFFQFLVIFYLIPFFSRTDIMKDLMEKVAKNVIRPKVSKVFPLEKVKGKDLFQEKYISFLRKENFTVLQLL